MLGGLLFRRPSSSSTLRTSAIHVATASQLVHMAALRAQLEELQLALWAAQQFTDMTVAAPMTADTVLACAPGASEGVVFVAHNPQEPSTVGLQAPEPLAR